MAIKQISLNTEPHVAEVGPHRLLFQPEIFGDQFLDSFSRLQEVQKQFSGAELTAMSGDQVRILYQEMRAFLARLMTPESAEEFISFEVVWGDDRSGPYSSREAAQQFADALGDDAKVVDRSILLPDRVLVELMEWVVELYGGAGARPTGSSSGSARSSSKGGRAGKAASRSRASIPAAGPSVPS